MHIVADANMPGLEPFRQFARITTVEGRELQASQLCDADVLLVRSVTRVDESLLRGSPVKFVGSATIGTDHVDVDYLTRQGIAFAHAPGCNARAVAEYVLQAVLSMAHQQGRDAQGCRVAVVGIGNVGRRVAAWLSALGLEVLACDPPLVREGVPLPYPVYSLDDALDADIITLHVPLTHSGPDRTCHLLDRQRLQRLGPAQMLINTCRGPVVDNQALLDVLAAGRGPLTVLDVWEEEPRVPPALFDQVFRGSPHIAGYSLEGKIGGTRMLYEALCEWLGEPAVWPSDMDESPLLQQDVLSEVDLLALLQQAYQLEEDHRRLGDSLKEADPARAFDRLRKTYPLRHELHYWRHQGRVCEALTPIVNRLFAYA